MICAFGINGWLNVEKYQHNYRCRSKKVYDNCTNNLKRRKLIQIKSRYWGYGICSSFELDCILKKDCSDEELFSYDYQIRYDALLIK